MASFIRYLDSNNSRQVRRISVLQAILLGIGRVAKRIVRMLSFDATNIFKSKEWPYY